jgi:hypothetical protein
VQIADKTLVDRPVDADVLLKGCRDGVQSMRMRVGQDSQAGGQAESGEQEQDQSEEEVAPPPMT